MLEVKDPQQPSREQYVTAPDVFIDLVYIEENTVDILFHLEDPFDRWLNNSLLLERLQIYISYDEQKFVQTLASIKSNFGFKNKSIHGKVSFEKRAPNATVAAYVFDNNIKGISTEERVLLDNKPAKSTLDSTTYQFINKVIDLRELKIDFNLTDPGSGSQDNELNNRIFVSDTTNKKSNIGFLFDLEYFLDNNSATYRTLKNYNNYKKIILEKTIIRPEDIIFYKKNISLNNQEIQKINSPVEIIRLDDDSYNYLLTITDDNKDILNNYLYEISCYINIKDYSNTFFKDEIRDIIFQSKQYINYYKRRIEDLLANNLLDNPYYFFYENIFEEEKEKITKTIQDLSEIYAFYSKKQKNIFETLFVNILHPLVTNVELLSRLQNSLDAIEAATSNFLEYIDTVNVPGISIPTKDGLLFSKKFNADRLYQSINYNYDYNTGYEVISTDNFDIRKEEQYSGLKVITAADKQARKILEDGKTLGVSRAPEANQDTGSNGVYTRIAYSINAGRQPSLFNTGNSLNTNPDPTIIKSLKNINEQTTTVEPAEKLFLSISSIDLKGSSAYLLGTIDLEDISFFNNLFVALNQYNTSENTYRVPEAYYYSILDKTANLKELSNGVNTSINSLQKTILFDPNLDSQQQSLQYIVETGIQDLYFYLDDNIFIDVPREIKNINLDLGASTVGNTQATLNNGAPILINAAAGSSTNETLSNDLKKAPLLKPKMIIMYNNYFLDYEIYRGKNYGLYGLQPSILNDMFYKKLKHFNQFYVVQYNQNVPWTRNPPSSNFIDELNYNIPTKYLNRVITEEEISIDLQKL